MYAISEGGEQHEKATKVETLDVRGFGSGLAVGPARRHGTDRSGGGNRAQAVVPAVEAAQDAAEQVQEQLSAARAVSYTPEGGTYEICTSDYRLRGAGQRELPRSLDHEYNVGVSIKNHMKRLRKRGAGCRFFDDSPGEDVPFGSLRHFGFIEIVSILIITKRGAPFPAPPAL